MQQKNGAPAPVNPGILVDPVTGKPTAAYHVRAAAEVQAMRDKAALGLSGQPIRVLAAALIVAIGRRIARRMGA